ncbi:hypothetical protein SLE2022_394650 [Rubroshorea leprosula]
MEGTAKATTAKLRTRRNGTGRFSRSKSFSLCFKPVVMDGFSVESTEPSSTYDPVEPLPPMSMSFDVKDKKNKGTRRRLSRLISAVLFETSLGKKVIKRKLSQRLTDNSLQPKTQKLIPNEFPEHQESLGEEDMRTASTLSSSLRYQSSMLSPYSSCLSERNAVRTSIQPCTQGVIGAESRKGYFGPNAGLSLLLISLLILTFWGRICAIFCTTTWLFFIPRWRIKPGRSEKMVKLSPEIESELYRKKAIMEGLLERNQRHG